MRKIILVLTVLLLCGCGRQTITCKYENKDESNKFFAKMVIKIKKDKVDDVTAYINYENATLAKTMCRLYQKSSGEENVICKEHDITLKNYTKDFQADLLSKDAIVKYFEDQKYNCK